MKPSDLRNLKYQEEFNAGRGLRARKNKDGTCSFLLMKRMPGKPAPLRLQLGIFPDMNIDEAEAKATQYRNLINDGIDPRVHEEEERQKIKIKKATDKSKAITLRQLLAEYQHSRQA
ncbi:MAG: Arm DNA-binding domain-containing protein, partial [Rhodospirillales bacterium]